MVPGLRLLLAYNRINLRIKWPKQLYLLFFSVAMLNASVSFLVSRG